MRAVLSRPSKLSAILLTLFIVSGTVLYLSLSFSDNSLHADEALYGYWGLTISSGDDPLLLDTVVDKPPLFPYLLALSFKLFGTSLLAARLPNLLATSASILLLYRLGTILYDRSTALTAALLFTLSPFTILFAPTAFTDPVMVALVLLAAVWATQGRPALAGLANGLAAMTKQSGLFFLPLILALACIGPGPARRAGRSQLRTSFLLLGGLLLPLLPVLVWDQFRSVGHGFLMQGWIHYGGLRLTDPFELGTELAKWGELLGYFTGSALFNGCLLIGLPLLLVYDLLERTPDRPRLAGLVRRVWARGLDDPAQRGPKQHDVVLLTFVLLYLQMHWLISFNPWDRYLLGLVPLLSVILARVLHVLPPLPPVDRSPWARTALTMAVILTLMGAPALTAAQAGYPIGSDHWAYGEVDQVAEFIRENVEPEAIIYHRWLGNYFLFYLYGAPQTIRWSETAYTLAEDVSAAVGDRPLYVVTTSGEDVGEMSAQLEDRGLTLTLLHEVHNRAGHVVFGIHRVDF